MFEPLLETNPAVRGRRGRPGRPRRRSDKLHADKGYDYRRCREYLHQRGITVRMRGAESRTSPHSAVSGWVVERTISWLRRFKRLGCAGIAPNAQRARSSRSSASQGARVAAAQYGDLVSEHQDLDILGCVGAGEQREPTQHVGER